MAEPTTATVDAPAPAAGQDGLDAAISAMEQQLFPAGGQAESQAPSQADATPPAQPAQAPAEQPTPTGDVQELDGSDDIDEGTDQPADQGGTRPSRSKRLAAQLTAAEQRALKAEQTLQQRQAAETEAVRQFVDLVLPDAQFEQLRMKAEGGDWEAKQQLDVARTWRRMAAPIADLAHKAVQQQFDAALGELRALDGMDGDGHQKLVQAGSPGEKLRLMWTLAKKASDDAHKERIASLEQEVQTLKTNRAANGAQPAHGGSPAQRLTGLAPLIDPKTGLLNEAAQNWGPDEIRAHFDGAAA